MMLYPTNSADRRQQPCTTTIRSRRAHPRHVLDTAALNAYVPNNVGSKSHNELTWNHVVSVFTFFGLLMTALVSLCCWSHFQFIVERRRLPANPEFNSQHRRLGDKKVTVSGNLPEKKEEIEGKYTEYTKAETDAGTKDVPKWYLTYTIEQLKTTYFYGGTDFNKSEVGNSITWKPLSSCTNCVKEGKYYDKKAKIPGWKCSVKVGKNVLIYKSNEKGIILNLIRGETATLRKDCSKCKKKGKIPGEAVTAARDANGWKEITGGRPHYVKGNCIIFFCAIQNKWHMCGPDGGIYYRSNGQDASLLDGKTRWYSQPDKDQTKGHAATDADCPIRVTKV